MTTNSNDSWDDKYLHAYGNAGRMATKGNGEVPSSVVVGEEEKETEVSVGRIGTKPQLSVRFVPHDQPAMRFDYGHYYCTVEETPKSVLVVTFTGHRVRIEGHNLGMLEKWIGDRKATLVTASPEAERAAGFKPDGKPRVYRLSIEEVKRG